MGNSTMSSITDLYKQLSQIASTRNYKAAPISQGSIDTPLSQVVSSFKPHEMSAPISSSPVAPVAPVSSAQGESGNTTYQPSTLPSGIQDPSSGVSPESDTAGLMPMLKKYWPILVATLAASYDRKHQNPTGAAAIPALPGNFTSSLPSSHFNRQQTAPPPSFYTYGQVPEHSYFSDNQLPTVDRAKGGSIPGGDSPLSRMSRYVPGHGSDGRADDVNAKLSNNEYVIDAETVAMLGNGSPDAGAKKLDQMRQKIRKHKGKNLSQGKISPDAHEDITTYLSGGK